MKKCGWSVFFYGYRDLLAAVIFLKLNDHVGVVRFSMCIKTLIGQASWILFYVKSKCSVLEKF